MTESVAVNVGGGADPAPDVVAIGDSVTAGFGYCGSGDSCDLDSKIEAWRTTLKGCQQEAEYPNAPVDLCSNAARPARSPAARGRATRSARRRGPSASSSPTPRRRRPRRAPRWSAGRRAPTFERRFGRADAGRAPGTRTVSQASVARPLAQLVFATAVGTAREATVGGADVALRVERALPARRVVLRGTLVDAARRTIYNDRQDARRDRADRAMDRRWATRTRCTRAAASNPACDASIGLWIW